MARLAPLVPGPLRPAAFRLRKYLRRFESGRVDHPLSPADARAELVPTTGTFVLERGQAIACPVRVRNLGDTTWSSRGKCPVRMAAHWLTSRKQPTAEAVTYFDLPHPIRPGETAVVAATLTAPETVGHYLVQFDLAQAGRAAFADAGSRPALVDAQVTGRASDDIDYYKVYATADFSKDFWTCVGPGTKDEFDRLGRAKLSILQRIGLTPDSRVLDIGCGTGQLAIVLEPYLSDRGQYYGTDIGPEAIDYCHQHYHRPNFGFAVNEMTRLPVYGREFDYITLFSVFTHTYPDETALILAEAKRVLAPDGVIYADLFTNPMVDRYEGNRGAVENNREHILRLAELAGLTVEVDTASSWGKYGSREFFKFTHG